jgi:protein-S-isoprenylcysteine O-methyltransferase Ste14
MVEFLSDPAALAAGTAALAWLSRKALRQPGSHGFYRFFAWEAILGLVVLNRRVWGEDPTSPHQMAAALLMLLSVVLALAGLLTLHRHGKPDTRRDDGSFYEFEKTTRLVSRGIFGHIRHPMYTSLLALAWGGYLQDPSLIGAAIAGLASAFLWLTAKTDERECLAYFGPPYADYMQRTKRFIPFLL